MAGFVEHRRGQGQALPQAQGQVPGEVPAPLIQPHQGQDLLQARLQAGRGEAVNPAEKGEVLLGGEVFVEGEALGHVADAGLDAVLVPDDVEAVHPALAGGGQQEAVQHADGGGLAGAVRPQEAEDFTLGHRKADAVHGPEFAEVPGQVPDLDGGALGVLVHGKKQGKARGLTAMGQGFRFTGPPTPYRIWAAD